MYFDLLFSIKMGQSWCDSQEKENQYKEIFKIPIQQLQSDSPRIVEAFRYPRRLLIPVQNNMKKTENNQRMYVRFRADLTEFVSMDVGILKHSQRQLTNLLQSINIKRAIEDNQYSNRDHFQVESEEQIFSIWMRNCYNPSEFLQASYELNTYWKIKEINNKHLHQIKECFCICDQNQKEYCLVSKMEPISCNLTEIIRYKRQKQQPWTNSEFLKLFRDLLQALQALHNASLTHNDIRCSNIFYSKQKTAFLLGSFGSVRNCYEKSSSPTPYLPKNRGISRKIARLQDFHLSSSDLKGQNIISLGMTLLSAFYLCQNIDRKKSAPFTRALISQFPCLGLIKQMIKLTGTRKTLAEIRVQVQQMNIFGEFIPTFLQRQVQSSKIYDRNDKAIAFAYKSLGLSCRWRQIMKEYLVSDQTIKDTLENARIFIQLANHSLSQSKIQQSILQFKHAAKIYSALAQLNFNQSCFKQSSQYYKLGLNALQSINNKQTLQIYKRLYVGLLQTQIIGGILYPSQEDLNNIEDIIQSMKHKDPYQYWILCKKLIRIYIEIKDYQKVEMILQNGLKVMENICDKEILFEIKRFKLINLFRICSYVPQVEKKARLSLIIKEIVNILKDYEYLLLQREHLKLQLDFYLLKAQFIQQQNHQLWKDMVNLSQNIIKSIKIKQKPSNYYPKCQQLKLSIKIHIQLGDITTQYNKSIQKRLQYYSAALTYARQMNGDLYNPKCLSILQKIINIYRNNGDINVFQDCQQMIKNIKKSIFGPLKQSYQNRKSYAQDSTSARFSSYSQRVNF